MHIKVQNAAKIRKADIELDGLTVIAGYNNVGKSTILKSIYIVFRTFRNSAYKVKMVRRRSLESYFLSLESYFEQSGYAHVPKNLLRLIAGRVSDNLAVFRMEGRDRLYLLHNILTECFVKYHSLWPDDLGMKGTFSDDFVWPIYEKIKEISRRDEKTDLKYVAEMYIRNVFHGQVNSLHEQSFTSVLVDSDQEQYFISVKENKIAEMMYSVNSEDDVFYLPAFNLLDKMEPSACMPGIYSIEHDIEEALAAQKKEPTFEEYEEIENNTRLVKDILKDVLHGKLEILPSGEIVFDDERLNNSVSIGNVASGMKNFLMIQSMVEKGKLKRNSILMIDEPETNLHPEWHLKFAEVLVLLYKYLGVRSIVNSHSPYFIRAIEVKMADENLKAKGHYYVIEEADRDMYRTQDVTDHTDKIYELLYRPLEYLS